MKVFHKMDAAYGPFVDHTDTKMMVYQLPECAKIFCLESYCCSYCILLFKKVKCKAIPVTGHGGP
jgi:hypothetical protein